MYDEQQYLPTHFTIYNITRIDMQNKLNEEHNYNFNTNTTLK